MAIDHPYHAHSGGAQALAALAVAACATEHQGLVRAEGVDILPVDQHASGILGLERQLAAIEQQDLAGQTITVVQPHGIGERRTAETKQQAGQQDAQRHGPGTGQ